MMTASHVARRVARKLAPEANDAERREDVLTSTVFGLLFATGAWETLMDWLKCARPVGHGAQLDAAPSDQQQYWFWPSLDRAEPDLVIRIGRVLMIIEAKYFSSKSGKDSINATRPPTGAPEVKDQLVREWRACSPQAAIWNYPAALRDAIQECDRALVYLVRRNRLARERRAAERSREQEPDARIYVLTWEDLDEVLAAEAGPLWIVELRAYLHRKRLTAFRGFRAAIGKASLSAKLRVWTYASAKAGAEVRGAFASDALPLLRRLASWRADRSCAASSAGWAYVVPPAALHGLSRLATHSL
jgi:hypothetical protein